MEDRIYSKLKASFEATQPQMPADFTDRVMKRIEQPAHATHHRKLWVYTVASIIAAACIVLLFYMGDPRNAQPDEKPNLVAQTDTTKTVPQAKPEKVEEHQQEKQEKEKKTDNVKRYRMPRPPKHYMANQSSKEDIPEPELIDADDMMEKAIAEEERRIEMEMMAKMNGSLQADYMDMAREIRERGERMSQRAAIAMSNEEY